MPTKDFSVLDPRTPEGEACIAKFDAAVEAKDRELNEGAHNQTVDQQYANLCAAIDNAIQTTLPNKTRGKAIIARKVSERTRKLFDQRTQMGKGNMKWT